MSGAPDSKASHKAGIPLRDDEISLGEIFSKILRRWYLIAIFGAVGLMVGIGVAKNTGFYYDAYMLVMPSQSGGNQTQGFDLRDTVTKALIGSNGAASSNFILFSELMTSTTVAGRLQEKFQLLQELNASRWNPASKTWKPARYDAVQGFKLSILNWFGYPDLPEPSVLDLSSYIDGSLSISLVGKSGLYRIEFRHGKPEEALRWLKLVYNETQEHMLQTHKETLRKQILFLEGEFGRTTALDHRAVLSSTLSKLVLELTMLQSGLPFVANVIEPPTVSGVPDGPRLFMIILTAVVLATVLGFVFIFAVDLIPLFRGNRKPGR